MHTIDIVSDVSCPWCIIGYRALKSAIDELGVADQMIINWKPFELNPAMPPEGQDRAEHIMLKYGISLEQAAQNRGMLVERGRQEGYEFNFAEGGRVYNTFDAHRLIHWAAEFGKQTELKLALFDLYFKHNGNPSDPEQLLATVEACGLNRDAALQLLESEALSKEVRNDQEWGRQNEISAVPTFIFDNKFMVSGGQQKAHFLEVLTHIQTQNSA